MYAILRAQKNNYIAVFVAVLRNDMKEISLGGLGGNHVALVDDEDYEELIAYSWGAIKIFNNIYARCTNGKYRNKTMHRVVTRFALPRIDHKDRNGLNNQKDNLRSATRSQNSWNRGPIKNSKSGFKGVTWNKREGCWQVITSIAGKYQWLGYFKDPIEAAMAYDAATVKIHGDFACPNFPKIQLPKAA